MRLEYFLNIWVGPYYMAKEMKKPLARYCWHCAVLRVDWVNAFALRDALCCAAVILVSRDFWVALGSALHSLDSVLREIALTRTTVTYAPQGTSAVLALRQSA